MTTARRDDVLDEVSAPARRVYAAMTHVAQRGICRATQRQLIAILGMAHKTFIPCRDELLRAGLIIRIHHFKGKPDWYRMVATTRVMRTREAVERLARKTERSQAAIAEARRQLALF